MAAAAVVVRTEFGKGVSSYNPGFNERISWGKIKARRRHVREYTERKRGDDDHAFFEVDFATNTEEVEG